MDHNTINNIHWFRSDLRIKDNLSLSKATRDGKTLCVFILEDKLIENVQYTKRLAFLFYSLLELKNSLEKLNSSLLLVKGRPADVLARLCKIYKIKNVYFNKDYSPFSIKRDNEVENVINDLGVKIIKSKDYVIYENNEILKSDGTPYKVFTAYKTDWLKNLHNSLSAVNEYKNINSNFIEQKDILEIKKSEHFDIVDIESRANTLKNQLIHIFTPGEAEASNRWQKFIDSKIFNYKNSRDLLSTDDDSFYTSQLSPYYKFGCISIRTVVRDCIKLIGKDFNDFRSIAKNNDKSGVESYLSEIIWREFYKMILSNFPNSVDNNFQTKFNDIQWEFDEFKYQSWCEGNTGYPIVDAAMRQMHQIGWMHNRTRMIVASFLCKDLHINWKIGERYFYQNLIDYDLGSNVGGWQWTAGTGTDASPYFRIFNPIDQGKKFDPEGKYIKRYIPQLQRLPKEFIHNPSQLKDQELNYYGLKLGKDYPYPIIDHKVEREKALLLYKV